VWANNETRVLFPVERIAEVCRSRGVLYHCDAMQAAGKLPIDVRKVPADYLSLTGHKFHAPKGIGALYIRRKAPFSPYVNGGHQERNMRGGAESVALIVGMGKAAVLTRKHLAHKKARPPCVRFQLDFAREMDEYGVRENCQEESNGNFRRCH